MEGFKRLIKFLIVAAILFGYYQWPKRSIRNFEEAVMAGDAETVKSMIDFEAFKKSMLEEIEELAVEAAKGVRGAPSEEKIRSAIRAEMAKASKVEVNEDVIVRGMIAQAKANAHLWKPGSADSSWEGPFTVSVGDPNGDTRVLLGFRGLNGWKIKGIKFGKNDIKKAMAMAGKS